MGRHISNKFNKLYFKQEVTLEYLPMALASPRSGGGERNPIPLQCDNGNRAPGCLTMAAHTSKPVLRGMGRAGEGTEQTVAVACA